MSEEATVDDEDSLRHRCGGRRPLHRAGRLVRRCASPVLSRRASAAIANEATQPLRLWLSITQTHLRRYQYNRKRPLLQPPQPLRRPPRPPREPIISPRIPKPEPMPVPEPEPAPALEKPEIPEANNAARSSALPPRLSNPRERSGPTPSTLNRLTPEEEARLARSCNGSS